MTSIAKQIEFRENIQEQLDAANRRITELESFHYNYEHAIKVEREDDKAEREAAERKLTELRTAAVKYYNEAPQEGDYAILLLSLSGTVKPELEEMMRKYDSARKELRDQLRALAQLENPQDAGGK